MPPSGCTTRASSEACAGTEIRRCCTRRAPSWWRATVVVWAPGARAPDFRAVDANEAERLLKSWWLSAHVKRRSRSGHLVPTVQSTVQSEQISCPAACRKPLQKAGSALAAHWIDDPLIKAAMAKVAHALGQTGSLTEAQVRDVLGTGLVEWLELRAPERQGELCST
jgi:hypothetical protein